MKRFFNSIKTMLLSLCLISSFLYPTVVVAQCDPVSDSLVLVAIYNALDGDNWINNENWLEQGQPIETWFGVTTNADGCVSRLRCYFNNLSGEFPPEIANLSNIVVLEIINALSSTLIIPPEIGNINSLRYLVLSNCGILPPEIGNLSDLTYLKISTAQTSVPFEIYNLSNLTYFDLNGSQLLGSIPPEIGNLTNLRTLKIIGFSITGDFPPEIGNLSYLNTLYIACSQMTGIFPSEIGNLSNLTSLTFMGIHFEGAIPSEIGNLSNLTSLSLNGNYLSGNIPPEIGNLSNLTFLEIIRHNQLTGSIPPEIGNLINLNSLEITGNSLTGSIPPEIGNLVNLNSLEITGNSLTGSIPSEIGNLINLNSLRITENSLTGSIPTEIGNLINLTSLHLAYNQLSGSIPAEIGDLSNLTLLLLNHNQLTGSLPTEIGNLSSLTSLNITENQLTGSLPAELGNLSHLKHIGLGNNRLSGSIPPELGNLNSLGGLYLNDNELTGSIPPEIGNLSQMTILFLGNNNLTGVIPPELGNFLHLVYLNLENNDLTGTIPSELGNHQEFLNLLKLNGNQLTGKLPIELSNLTSLQQLNLDDNQFYGCIPPQYAVFCELDSIDFSNNTGLPNNGDFAAFCENDEGACDPTILGQIIFDENLNCSIDSLEVGLQNWMIKASSQTGDLYGISDPNGCFSIYTYPEEYTIELFPSGPYWEENCAGVTTVNIQDSLSLDTINFFSYPIVDCPFLTVDISTPFLRPCFSNTYTVNYCNKGTITAENTSIEVLLDDLIIIDSTSIPITEQVGQTLFFELNDIIFNECGFFNIYTHVNCDAELGQTLCTTAHIYPDSICAEISPEWSGATVVVQGACEGNEVHFEIKNIGNGNMQESRTYIIVEDGLILLEAPETFILNSEEAVDVNLPANGATYILRAMQVNGHPVPSMPTAFVEGCGVNEAGDFSTGFVTQFPEDDNAPFVSIDCQEVIGSYDPNDKNGYPKGYADEHFIEKGQDVEYHIRFQNTGTDTAFTVMVEDVISSNLEMTSLKLGASSHPYKVEFGQHNELQFIFENINLLDSFSNEAASHGFVKFKISQKEDLPIGAQIENTASIFFDFNEAVVTNTTLHTIGENFVEIVAIEQPFIPNLNVSLAPNPVINEATIRLSGISFKNAQLSLFNEVGVLIRQEHFIGNEYMLKRGDLPTGVYFFEVIVDSKKGFVGKLVVQ